MKQWLNAKSPFGDSSASIMINLDNVLNIEERTHDDYGCCITYTNGTYSVTTDSFDEIMKQMEEHK